MTADASEGTTVFHFPLVSGKDGNVEALTAVIRRLASAGSLPEVMEIVTTRRGSFWPPTA